jgi:hypothetical protein
MLEKEMSQYRRRQERAKRNIRKKPPLVLPPLPMNYAGFDCRISLDMVDLVHLSPSQTEAVMNGIAQVLSVQSR